MAKAPQKKKAAEKSAPSSSSKKIRSGVVTFGKNVTLGKGVK